MFVYVIVPNRIGYICLVAKSFLSNIITSPFNVKLRTGIRLSHGVTHIQLSMEEYVQEVLTSSEALMLIREDNGLVN